jgi:hypothetical protein
MREKRLLASLELLVPIEKIEEYTWASMRKSNQNLEEQVHFLDNSEV